MRPVLITRLTGLASSLALFSIGTPIHAMADDPTALHLPFTDAAFSFPSELSGALRVSANLNGYAIPFAVSGRYANSDSVVTFYVYRGSYNSVALWFERIEAVTPILYEQAIMESSTNLLSEDKKTSIGLITTGNVVLKGRKASRSYAVFQSADWIILGVAASEAKSPAELKIFLKNSIADWRLPAPSFKPILDLPKDCSTDDTNIDSAIKTRRIKKAERAEAETIMEQMRNDRISLRTILVFQPEEYCRDIHHLRRRDATLYRPIDKSNPNWVIITGNVGYSITNRQMRGSPVKFALVTTKGFNAIETLRVADGLVDPALAERTMMAEP